jgi:hypothetical protein
MASMIMEIPAGRHRARNTWRLVIADVSSVTINAFGSDTAKGYELEPFLGLCWCMAGEAGNVRVRTSQGPSSLLMVKGSQSEGCRIVARLAAIRFELSRMGGIVFVTGGTFGVHTTEGDGRPRVCFVARSAGLQGVCTIKWELRSGVVERVRGREPCRYGMTGLTRFTRKLPIVGIIFRVTSNAGRIVNRQVDISPVGIGDHVITDLAMALAAENRQVRALKGVIGFFGMAKDIEGGWCPSLFGVARGAVLFSFELAIMSILVTGSAHLCHRVRIGTIPGRGKKGQLYARNVHAGIVARSTGCSFVLTHQFEPGQVMVEVVFEPCVGKICPAAGGMTT